MTHSDNSKVSSTTTRRFSGRKRSHPSQSSVSSPSTQSDRTLVDDDDTDSTGTSIARSVQKRRLQHTTADAIRSHVSVQRSVPAFLNKLYSMVNDASTDDMIRWSSDGASFIVQGHEEFSKQVLPRFYKHNTFASFVRQLNMYDFHKIPHIQQGVLISDSKQEIWEFSNPHFQRGRPDLLMLVARKRNRDRSGSDQQVSLSTIVQDIQQIRRHQSAISSDLHSLRQDNQVLWEESFTAREKHQQHQDAIAKILQFLMTVFAKDHTPSAATAAAAVAGASTSEAGNLIKEAASLAGMDIPQPAQDELDQDTPSAAATNGAGTYASANTSKLDLLLAASRTLNMFVHENAHLLHHHPHLPGHHPRMSDRVDDPADRTSTPIPAAALPSLYPFPAMDATPQYLVPPGSALMDMGPVGAPTATIDTASRSAKAISDEIDTLQSTVEALASNLGIEPSLLTTADLTSSPTYYSQFATDYGSMIASATQDERNQLFELAQVKEAEAAAKHVAQQQQQQQQHSAAPLAARRASSNRVPSPVLRTSMNASFDTGRTSTVPSTVPIPIPVPVAIPTSVPMHDPSHSDTVAAAAAATMFHNYSVLNPRIDGANGSDHSTDDKLSEPACSERQQHTSHL